MSKKLVDDLLSSPPRVSDLWSLIKPRIVALLCITGIAALFAAGGASLTVGLGFTAAGACIAASAAAFNCYYDRNLDQHMDRTADRPLPSGRLDSRVAFGFAVALFLLGSVIALGTLPIASVVYMWLGTVSYVGLYTMLLKRRHWMGVVLGGSAGSFPVLAGWTAVAPLTVEPLLLALLVFAWTPAHAWALAYVYRSDFIAADVPTLPAIASVKRVRRSVWVSVWVTLSVAVAAIPFTSPPYGITVIVGGTCLVLGYSQFYREGTEAAAVRAFFTSNLFLAAVFFAWGLSGVIDSGETLLRIGVILVLPFLFYRLWTLGLSLRGVNGAPGNELNRLTSFLSKKINRSPGERAPEDFTVDSDTQSE